VPSSWHRRLVVDRRRVKLDDEFTQTPKRVFLRLFVGQLGGEGCCGDVDPVLVDGSGRFGL
jgi:hypothetical protein